MITKETLLFKLESLYEQAQEYVDLSKDVCKRTQWRWNELDYLEIKEAIEELYGGKNEK